MNLLALTTSTPHWSVWLHRADGWERAIHVESGRGTGQRASLTRMVWDVLADADLTPAQLELVVCDVGPGSFTGLRQGLALARALAWAHGIPTRGVSSLDAMLVSARAELAAGVTCAAALAARADVDYVACGDGALALAAVDAGAWWQANRPDVLVVVDSDRTRPLAHYAAAQGARIFTHTPDAACMGRIALAEPAVRSPLEPRYLAVSEAEAHAGIAMPDVAVPPSASDLPPLEASR